MKIRLIGALILCALLSFSSSYAQSVNFTDVKNLSIRNSGPIIANDVVKGYYQLYEVEKLSRKERSYLLTILDANLNKIGEASITGSKNLYLMEGNFDGTAIGLSFYDFKEQKSIIYRYGTNAKLLAKDEFEVTKIEALLAAQLRKSGEEVRNAALFSVQNKGFALYRQLTSRTYAVEFFQNNGTQKNWRYETEKGKVFESATFLASSPNLLLSNVFSRQKALDKDLDSYVLAHDPNTGKKLFYQKIEGDNFKIMLMNGSIDEDKGLIYLYGPYFHVDQKAAKENSQGIGIYTMNMEGKIISRKYISWLKDVNKFVPVNAKGKIEDVGYVFFHNFIRTQDGKIFAIGEQYRKTVSGSGIALSVAFGAGAASLAKIVTEDLMVFQMSSDFELEGVEIVEKFKTNVTLPPGYELSSPQMIALLLKNYGWFDYEFTQRKPNSNRFFVGYYDYEKLKGEKNRGIFGSMIYDEGTISIDKMAFDDDASFRRILPGKPGYVVVMSYFRKEKQLSLELKRINY